MFIRNLDYLFQNISQRVKYYKSTTKIFQTAKFLLSFYNNTGCNEINQMAALRMDWHSLISTYKSSSRAMLSECLMILDHLSREVEL